jgi:superfamily II DNA or RNA helicase
MSNLTAEQFVKAPVIPARSAYTKRVLYCYTMPDEAHRDMVKIGDTELSLDKINNWDGEEKDLAEEAAHKRILQQIGATGSPYNLEWALIVWHDPYEVFRDHAVHRILEANKIERVHFKQSGAREWFLTTPEGARQAYVAYSKGVVHLETLTRSAPVLRNEQNSFINNTIEIWANGGEKCLWNAKMRFGKTLTALSFVNDTYNTKTKKKPISKVLILTHRPDVLGSWREEYEIILKPQDWQFSSKDNLDIGFDKIDINKPFVYFSSMQDLRGSDATLEGFKKSNKDIFETEWDLVIIDEAHEGNETDLANQVHEALTRSFTLYLSGTPFKYLASDKFVSEEIKTWDYVDEQKAKLGWDYSQGNNPYESLAKLSINAFDIRESVKSANKGKYLEDIGEDASFNFAEFFRVDNKGKFIHEDDVKAMLDRFKGDNEPFSSDKDVSHMPYSSSFIASTLHSLWVLPPSVAACKAMATLLDADAFFKDYKIINAAGSDNAESKNALRTVQTGVKNNPKTITLTVGKLTTGVTVPEWSAVMMLTNTTSASFYMQTIFRVQSPYYNDGNMKTDAFVWDLAPDRVLKVFSDVAEVSTKAGAHNSLGKMDNLGNMLNYMPIIGYTTAEDFRIFEASDVTRELKKIYSSRVLASGFDSNLLFTKSLETLTSEVRAAIEGVRVATGKNPPDTRNRIDNTIKISDTPGFGPASYSNDGDLQREVEVLVDTPSKTEEEKALLEAKKKELKERENIRNILRTISVRFPFMVLALMGDAHFRENRLEKDFSLKDFADAFDEESWKEFFGAITKETFLSLEPAFDKEVLQNAISAWIEEIEKILSLRETDIDAFILGVESLMSKIKNPNKETVFTPMDMVNKAYYVGGFINDEAWKKVVKNIKGNPSTFYDINVKSGLFPLVATYNLYKNSGGKSWIDIANDSIFANSRTLAGKWATCTLLGMPKDWVNITVIDVNKELGDLTSRLKLSSQTLSEDNQRLFMGALLKRNMLNKLGKTTPNTMNADDFKEWVLAQIQGYEKAIRDISKDKKLGEDEKRQEMKRAKGELSQALNPYLFDYTVSNPPYQINLVETTSKAKPIWQDFLRIASDVSNHVIMINPARWQKGGNGTGLAPIRKWLFDNRHLEKVINIPGEEAFPTASIAGNISIEVIDNTKIFPKTKIGTWTKANSLSKLEDLKITEEIDMPLSKRDYDIVSKIQSADLGDNFEKELWVGGESQTKRKSSHSNYTGGNQSKNSGLMGPRLHRDTDYFILESEKIPNIDYVKIWYNPKGKDNAVSARYLPRNEFLDNPLNIQRFTEWKVLIPKTGGNFIYRNLGPLGEPNSLSTNTWICRSFESKKEALNFQSYIQTYFYRYLLSVRNVTHNAYANLHRFAPDLANAKNPRTGKVGYDSNWIDDDLVVLLKDFLTEDDWRYIKATAIAADGGRGDYEAGWKFKDSNKPHHSLSIGLSDESK